VSISFLEALDPLVSENVQQSLPRIYATSIIVCLCISSTS